MVERNRMSTTNRGVAKGRSSFEWGSVEKPGNNGGEREEAFRRVIFAIPPGKVSSYGGVAMVLDGDVVVAPIERIELCTSSKAQLETHLRVTHGIAIL